jgi:hypothetical protein
MKKKRKTGASHYRENLGLKPILVYVDKKAHAKLLKMAEKEGSLQKLVRKILEGYTDRD